MSLSSFHRKILKYSSLFFFISSALNIHNIAAQEKPNVIYILADDLGYGDLSCYGQKKFLTPHIDMLAQKGIKFTNHYSGSTVSAPSRSSLMTGQHTGHTPIRGNGTVPLPAASITVAEMFQDAGYKTGQFGKWGLGEPGTQGDPNTQGFDEFFGYIDQARAHRYYPDYLIDNGVKAPLPGNDWTNLVTYSADTIHQRALEFIDKNKNDPFFLYCSYTIPHAELIVPDDSILKKYEGRLLPEKVHSGNDYIGPGTVVSGYCSQEQCHAVFAAMVYRLDLYVGQIVKKLKDHGIIDSTLIIFTSDNGPHKEGGGAPNFFSSRGGLRGMKRDLYEAGIRVPCIVSWAGTVPFGIVSNHISAFWDFLPTCADLLNVQVSAGTDGISFLPEILQQGEQKKHEFLYWEFYEENGRRAARKGKWKAVQYDMKNNPYAPVKLFNLSNDISEGKNLASSKPDTVAKMLNIMEMSHVSSNDFNWAYEDKKLRATFVLIAHDAPLADKKVTFGNNGTRITWKNGLAVYTGVTKSSNPTLTVFNGSQIQFTKQVPIDSSDIVDTIDLTTKIAKPSNIKEKLLSCEINSNNNFLSIQLATPLTMVELFTLHGKKMMHRRTQSPTLHLPIRHLPKGIYTVRISGQHHSFFRKIYKRH